MRALLLILFLIGGLVSAQTIDLNGYMTSEKTGDQIGDSLDALDNIDGDLTVAGILKYEFPHAVASFDAGSYTPSITKDVYTKMVPGMTVREVDEITMAADSVIITHAGDYRIDISVALSGTNANDFWRVKVYHNNVAYSPELGRFRWRTVAGGVTDTRSYFWYVMDLAVNDRICWKITNETASRNPTITDMKIFISMLPE